MPLGIAGRTIPTDVLVVSGVGYDLILGSDFFQKHACQIDYAGAALRFEEAVVPIRFQKERPVVCRIRVETAVSVEPGQEIILSARLERKGSVNARVMGVVDPVLQ